MKKHLVNTDWEQVRDISLCFFQKSSMLFGSMEMNHIAARTTFIFIINHNPLFSHLNRRIRYFTMYSLPNDNWTLFSSADTWVHKEKAGMVFEEEVSV